MEHAAHSARLARYGTLRVSGSDARAFLHAQLTKDIAGLAPVQAALAGWCSAKGRLLASLLVVPQPDAFVLQLARDLAETVARRLRMFVLRSKVTIEDASDATVQIGVWGAGTAARLRTAKLPLPDALLGVARDGDATVVRLGAEQALLLAPAAQATAIEQRLGAAPAAEAGWTLQEIRAGRPLIEAATQDRFVPQMVNLEAIGGVDFDKGCYPGQEIVARARYRGQVKRRMVRARVAGAPALSAGQDLAEDGATVLNVAPADGALELLAVVPLGAAGALHVAPGGPALERLALPYE